MHRFLVLGVLLVGCAARRQGPLHDVQRALEEIDRVNTVAASLPDGPCASQQRALLASTEAAARRAAADHRESLAAGQADAAQQDYARVVLAASQAQGLRATMGRCEG